MPKGTREGRRALGEILVDSGTVTEDQIQEALQIQKERGEPMGKVLVELGYVTENQILMALGEQAGMDVVDLDAANIPPELIELVSKSVAAVYRVFPVKLDGGTLTVAMADPLNVSTLDDLRFLLNCEVRGAVSNDDAVTRAIDKHYADSDESVETLLAELDGDDTMMEVIDEDGEGIDIATLEEMANQMPVVKLLNLVLLQAIKDKASDIHFEPFEDEYKIRYRVDGVLYEMMPPPRHLSVAISSRIKVMAQLDIAERRLPQDGRIPLTIAGNPVDLRISTLPTMFGESVVMRVLDRSVVQLDLEKIGLRDDEMDHVRELIGKPNGIILLTGPTGCGKTTTLYSALNEANQVTTKIITTEDPVEYDLDGIMQVQINEEIGVTFASCLRSILRQDPDKILVGEIRDLETGQIAIQASLTGHVVFSTLHTNDAPSAVTRLLEIGLEPYLIAATLECIIAERLVRVICANCKETYQPTEEMLMELSLSGEDVQGKRFYYGRGCDTCNNTGYRGRTGIFEMMVLDDDLRQLIIDESSTQHMRDVARQRGMRTLRESGLLKIFDGTTTIEEVIRETQLQ
jgi:type IV pilus assembly protein PilB